MKKLTLMALAFSVCLLSCSDGDTSTEPTAPDSFAGAVSFKSEIATAQATKITDAGDNFTENDAINVTAYSSVGVYNSYENVEYVFGSTIFTATSPIVLDEYQTLSYVATYPAQSVGETKSFGFSAEQDQSAGVVDSDLLVAAAVSSDAQPTLTFEHMMSSFVINSNFYSTEGENLPTATIKVDAYNAITVTCDTEAGEVSAQTTTSALTYGMVPYEDNDDYTILFAPQVADNVTITLTLGTRQAVITFSDELTFEAGKRYSYTWDVDYDELYDDEALNYPDIEFTNVTVTDWTLAVDGEEVTSTSTPTPGSSGATALEVM